MVNQPIGQVGWETNKGLPYEQCQGSSKTMDILFNIYNKSIDNGDSIEEILFTIFKSGYQSGYLNGQRKNMLTAEEELQRIEELCKS